MDRRAHSDSDRPALARSTRPRVRVGLVAGALVLCALSAPSSVAPSAHARAETPCPPLPPGEYFLRGYDTCPGCVRPTHAVVALITRDVREARAVAADLEGRLPLGYPWIKHTDELGLDASDQGIAIVAGLFASESAARAWRAAQPVLPAASRTLRFLPREVADQRYFELLGVPRGLERLRAVTQVDRGAPKPAYRESALPEWGQPGDAAGAPLCHVPPSSFFVFSQWDVERRGYDWAPVRCGDEVAYVRWTDSRGDTAVHRLEGGTHRLVQVVAVECDTPTFGEWVYDAQGRHPLPAGARRLVERARRRGCGAKP